MARLAAVDRATLQQPEAPEIHPATTVETALVELEAVGEAVLVVRELLRRHQRAETVEPEPLATLVVGEGAEGLRTLAEPHLTAAVREARTEPMGRRVAQIPVAVAVAVSLAEAVVRASSLSNT
jgi:tRNA G18 (ribose-2'-O)-methylase SpoU